MGKITVMVRFARRWRWIVLVAVVCAVSACSSPYLIEEYGTLGIAKLKVGRYQEAIADYDQALLLQPDNPDFYHLWGIAKVHLHQFQAAIVDYDEAIKLQPDNAEAYHKRGHAKFELGRRQDAVSDLRIAKELALESGDSELIGDIEQLIQEIGQD